MKYFLCPHNSLNFVSANNELKKNNGQNSLRWFWFWITCLFKFINRGGVSCHRYTLLINRETLYLFCTFDIKKILLYTSPLRVVDCNLACKIFLNHIIHLTYKRNAVLTLKSHVEVQFKNIPSNRSSSLSSYCWFKQYGNTSPWSNKTVTNKQMYCRIKLCRQRCPCFDRC